MVFIQHFGALRNAYPLHIIVLAGLYEPGGAGAVRLQHTQRLDDEDLAEVYGGRFILVALFHPPRTLRH